MIITDWPSRDFTVSMVPSIDSTRPRMRWVGGDCAKLGAAISKRPMRPAMRGRDMVDSPRFSYTSDAPGADYAGWPRRTRSRWRDRKEEYGRRGSRGSGGRGEDAVAAAGLDQLLEMFQKTMIGAFSTPSILRRQA